MKEIRLHQNYKIGTNPYNYVLYKYLPKTEKSKTDSWRPIAYFSTLELVLQDFLDKELLDSDEGAIKITKRAITTIRNAKEEIKDFIKGLK